MEQLCDHQSVGVIVRNSNQDIVLLNRARFPYGLAAPAGHVDDHGSLEQAAIDEVFEEVGLVIPISGLVKVINQRRVDGNVCRRQGGDYHVWTVYRADNIDGAISASQEETRGASWYTPDRLQQLAEITRQQIESEVRPGAQTLEHIWLNFFEELSLVK